LPFIIQHVSPGRSTHSLYYIEEFPPFFTYWVFLSWILAGAGRCFSINWVVMWVFVLHSANVVFYDWLLYFESSSHSKNDFHFVVYNPFNVLLNCLPILVRDIGCVCVCVCVCVYKLFGFGIRVKLAS
jgi:hypothetical protein